MINHFYFNLDEKNLDEKLSIIEEIEDSEDIAEADLSILDKLSRDKDDEIRARVAEVLVFTNSIKAENILIRLIKDKDELVRVNACDSLCNSNSVETVDYLKERILKDKSNLVKGYAVLSLADVAININYNTDNLSIFLLDVLKKEKIIWVKINLYKALYMLGNKTYLNLLLNEINNRYYRNRCIVVNILADLLTSENFLLIKTVLEERLKVEKVNAVISSIQKVTSIIEQNFN